ncbi:MAG: outer membrane protein assembly factor BamD [Pyrinomonadaceae bacterium]
MKRNFLAILFAATVFSVFAGSAVAQRNVTPAIDRDPLIEADAKHNLDVAWQSYKLKKAYKGVLTRFEETYAAYPEFSKIDEFLYLAGMSSYFLSENKGKQKVDLKLEKEKDKFAPAKLKEDAIAYLSLLVEKYPESRFREDAAKTLKSIQVSK